MEQDYPKNTVNFLEVIAGGVASFVRKWNARIAVILPLLAAMALPGMQAQAQVIEAWAERYNGTGNSNDIASAMVIDDSGNVYVTGYSLGNGTNYDYATIKYDAAGMKQWEKRYDGTGNSDDKALALAIDGSGNVYVTGYSIGNGTNYDYATIKYNAAGVEQWVQRYDSPGNGSDLARTLAVDGSGNVYVTGSTNGNGTSVDYATIKYDAAGVEQWVQRYNGPGISEDVARALAIDGSGNVYVTGYSDDGGFNYDYVTIKYDAAGDEQWVSRYNGPGNNFDDYATALAVDGSGNVYVTGYSSNGNNDDYATIKYNSAGVQQWVSRYNGPANSYDYATALAVDGSGNVYVTGRSSNGNNDDYATIKYNFAGVQQWVQRYNGPGNNFDVATAIAVDGSGNVYVTGNSIGNGSGGDYATIKYNAGGIEKWVNRYNGTGNGNDYAYALAVDGSGNVYVTGFSDGGGFNNDYATIRYIDPECGNIGNKVKVCHKGKEICVAPNAVQALVAQGAIYGPCNPARISTSPAAVSETSLQAYPNPFTANTQVGVQVATGGKYKAELFDLKGQRVSVIAEGEAEGGTTYTHEIAGNDLASGIYLVRLVAATEVKYLKLVLER